jgi:hypothetical protein
VKRVTFMVLFLALMTSPSSAFHKNLNSVLIREAMDYGSNGREAGVVEFCRPWLFRAPWPNENSFVLVGTKWFTISVLARSDSICPDVQLVKSLAVNDVADIGVLGKLDRLFRVIYGYRTSLGAYSIRELKEALEGEDIDPGDLTTDSENTQKLASVFVAANYLLLGGTIEKAENAFDGAKNRVAAFLSELAESPQTTATIKLITPSRGGSPRETLSDGNAELYRLYRQLKDSAGYFHEHDRLLINGNDVVVDFPMIVEEVSTDDLAEAILKIAGAYKEFEGADLDLNTRWFASAVLSRYNACETQTLARDDNFPLVFTVGINSGGEDFETGCTSILKVDTLVIRPVAVLHPTFSKKGRLAKNADVSFHVYDQRNLPEDANIRFIVISGSHEEVTYSIDLSKIE